MTPFEQHLERTRRADGTYDLAAAETGRAEEIISSEESITTLARKAAQSERRAWERNETERLAKQFVQPALSPDLELDVKVPLGRSVAVLYGDMNKERIRLRRDMRTRVHLGEIHGFEAEMRHWFDTEDILGPHQTIREARDSA